MTKVEAICLIRVYIAFRQLEALVPKTHPDYPGDPLSICLELYGDGSGRLYENYEDLFGWDTLEEASAKLEAVLEVVKRDGWSFVTPYQTLARQAWEK